MAALSPVPGLQHRSNPVKVSCLSDWLNSHDVFDQDHRVVVPSPAYALVRAGSEVRNSVAKHRSRYNTRSFGRSSRDPE